MLAKIFQTGKGAIDYLQSKEHCPVLRGDSEITQSLIDASRFKTPSTAGVLSFEELIDREEAEQIIDRFEAEVLCPGISSEDYSITWVEHHEPAKDGSVRTGLHFVIANTHLSTGKRIQPYYDRADHPRKSAWQAVINDEFMLSDPDALQNRRTVSIDPRMPETAKEAKLQITGYLTALISEGEIKTPQGIRDAVTKGLGLKIVRDSERGISVKMGEGKQNLRLHGKIYERRKNNGPDAADKLEIFRNGTVTEIEAERIGRAREKLPELVEIAAERNARLCIHPKARGRKSYQAKRAGIERTVSKTEINDQSDPLRMVFSYPSPNHRQSTTEKINEPEERNRPSNYDDLNQVLQRIGSEADRLGREFTGRLRNAIRRRSRIEQSARAVEQSGQSVELDAESASRALHQIDAAIRGVYVRYAVHDEPNELAVARLGRRRPSLDRPEI